jgi:flagellar export protein FliJ
MATVRGEDLHMWRRYYQGLEERLAQQQGVVREAAQVLTTRQQELITARQAEKMLAGMADKAQQRYLCTLARHEQQLLDEIAIARACHGYSTDTD